MQPMNPATAVAILILLGIALAGTAGCDAQEPGTGGQGGSAGTTPQRISMEEFDNLRQQPDAVVIDVRTPEEFEAGHIAGAVNVPLAAEGFEQKVAQLDPGKTYLVLCARGARSKRACNVMAKQDLKALYDFSGGMNAWERAGKPVKKGAGG